VSSGGDGAAPGEREKHFDALTSLSVMHYYFFKP
jgi:hypothetical protein